MPTPVRGTYQMKVKLNIDRAVSENNFDNNTATVSKVKLYSFLEQTDSIRFQLKTSKGQPYDRPFVIS